MYAVIEAGGRQHKVQVNTTITMDRLALPEGTEVQFDRVFLIGSDRGAQVGTPTVAEAMVRGRILKHLRGPKIRGFKYKPKKRYRRRFGHRSDLTQVFIEAIEAGMAADLVAKETATDEEIEEATAADTAGPETAEESHEASAVEEN